MKRVLIGVAIALMTVLVYWPSTGFDLVNYDDYTYVKENDHVKGGVSVENLKWAVMSCGYALNWHPLAWISMQVDGELAKRTGRNLAHILHAHNVCQHALNAVLLWLLMMLMVKSNDGDVDGVEWMTAVATLVWAVHPLRTEVVCWVSERKELVSVTWMLIALLIWVKWRNWAAYLMAMFAFAFALAAKPVAVSLPAVMMAWDLAMRNMKIRTATLRIAAFGVMSLVACKLTMAAQVEALDVGSNQFSVWERIVMTLNAPMIYLRQTVWPSGLSIHYPVRPPVYWVETILGAVLIVAMIWIVMRWLRRHEKWTALGVLAVAWCYVSLVPMLGIVKVGDQSHSDRYTYWIGCGFTVILALALGKTAAKLMADCEWRKKMMIVAGCVVAGSVFATLDREQFWHDTKTLFMDSVPKCWAGKPVVTLSVEFRKEGENGVRKAEAMLREALTHSEDSEIYAELAHLLATKLEKSKFVISDNDETFDEVKLYANRALQINPKEGRAYEALAVVKMKEGKWSDARGLILKARENGEKNERTDCELELCDSELKRKDGK